MRTTSRANARPPSLAHLAILLTLCSPISACAVSTTQPSPTAPTPPAAGPLKLALGPPSPTHWVVEDGEPTIEGRLALWTTAERRDGAALTVRVIRSDDGVTRAQWSAPQPLANGSQRFSLKPVNAPEGNYQLVAEFLPRSGKPARAEVPWRVIRRRLAHVELSAKGFPVHSETGHEIFPLGFFNGGKFAEQAAAGFNVTHAYNAIEISGGDAIAADRRAWGFLDSTASHGMKALMLVPMAQVIAGDWDVVRDRVRMFRNHPALLAWDEEEGFARGDFKPDRLATLRRIIREEDPHHPFMVGDSRDAIRKVRDGPDFFPQRDMDLGMWWWYPFPLKRPRAGAVGAASLDGNGLPRAGNGSWDWITPPGFLADAPRGSKPLWCGVQSYRKPGTAGRFPTPQESRAQAYLAIIGGAKGLMWYGGSVQGGLFDAGGAPEQWNDLRKLVRELRDIEPTLLSPSGEPPALLPPEAPVATCVKLAPSGRVLIAVNRSPQPLDNVRVAGAPDPLHFDAYGVIVRTIDGPQSSPRR